MTTSNSTRVNPILRCRMIFAPYEKFSSDTPAQYEETNRPFHSGLLATSMLQWGGQRQYDSRTGDNDASSAHGDRRDSGNGGIWREFRRAAPESGLHPDRQPGRLDARLLRQPGYPHAEYRQAGIARYADDAGLQQQSRLLADAGDVFNGTDSVAAWRAQLSGRRAAECPSRARRL